MVFLRMVYLTREQYGEDAASDPLLLCRGLSGPVHQSLDAGIY
jgi:hypothetical protein